MKATLTYHSIDGSGSPISVSDQAFNAQVEWLASGRLRVVSLDDLIALPDSEDAVALTFDDGFANILEPVLHLRAMGMPVTLFVVTGRVGSTNVWRNQPSPGIPTLPLLTWGQIERLQAAGVTIEAHTRTHAALSDLSDRALDEEFAGCQHDLVARLGARSTHVAYPYGDVDARVADVARRHYRFAHTTEFAPLRHGQDAWRLPRLDMYYSRSRELLRDWGQIGSRGTIGWIGLRRLARHVLVGGPHPGGKRRWTR